LYDDLLFTVALKDQQGMWHVGGLSADGASLATALFRMTDLNQDHSSHA
jgi:hypothetical protein